MKILFFNTYLGGGGAGRNMVYVINRFAQLNEDVKVILLCNFNNEYISDLRKNVKVKILNRSNIVYSLLPLLREIIKFKPDICYTGNYGLNIALAPFIPILKIRGIKFISRETHVLSSVYRKTICTRMFYNVFYNKYDAIIAQSRDMKDDLINNWGISEKKVKLINNPIDIEKLQLESLDRTDIALEKNYFVSVGRLVHQKGYDIILERMSEMHEDSLFHLYIIGSGDQESLLRNLVNKFMLHKYVHFLGFKKNPYPYIRGSRGLLLPSRHEGFPNVLLEANALGVPVFANKCPGGINEIIIQGVNGFSCNFEDHQEFIKILRLYRDCNFDNQKIITITRERYGEDIILNKYSALFNGIYNDNSMHSHL